MPGNPNVPQGSLNRVRGSVSLADHPELNVTAPYLGTDGINFAIEGTIVEYFPTMTGAVTSPEPYVMATCTIHLVRTQQLADDYKVRWELDARLGSITVRPDLTNGGVSPFDIINCSITSVREQRFSGRDPQMAVTLRGYYSVNSNLFN